MLGINDLQRSPLLPGVPTLDESGLKGFESSNWNGIMAPAGFALYFVGSLKR